MPWIACLALMTIAMLISSVIGAELNFRRNLERRERLDARRSAARGQPLRPARRPRPAHA
jgi:hypothetical protein